MEIDVTENVTSSSWLLCYQKKQKEIQERKINLKKKLIYEEWDQSYGLALEDHSCN